MISIATALTALDVLADRAALHDLQLAADIAAVTMLVDQLTAPDCCNLDPAWVRAALRRIHRMTAQAEPDNIEVRRLCRLNR